jgi:hypothetical protein
MLSEPRNKCCFTCLLPRARARALSLSLILSHSLSLAFSSDGVPDLHLQHGAERSECVGMCAHAQARLHVNHAQHAAHTLNAEAHTWTICYLHTSKEMVARMCTEALACTSNETALSDLCVSAVSVDIII